MLTRETVIDICDRLPCPYWLQYWHREAHGEMYAPVSFDSFEEQVEADLH